MKNLHINFAIREALDLRSQTLGSLLQLISSRILCFADDINVNSELTRFFEVLSPTTNLSRKHQSIIAIANFNIRMLI